MPQTEKWILRSRRWQAAIITILTGLVGFGLVPQDILEPINKLLDTMVGSLLPAALQTYAGLVLLWSYARPDNAKVRTLPDVKPLLKVVPMLSYLTVIGVAGGLLLMVACGTSGVTVYKVVNGEPEPVAEITQHFAGKGCVGVDAGEDGKTKVIVKQWGTSDWSVSRMVSWIADLAASVPMVGGGGVTKTAGMAGPTEDVYDMDCSLEPAGDPEDDDVVVLPKGANEDAKKALRDLAAGLATESAE